MCHWLQGSLLETQVDFAYGVILHFELIFCIWCEVVSNFVCGFFFHLGGKEEVGGFRGLYLVFEIIMLFRKASLI